MRLRIWRSNKRRVWIKIKKQENNKMYTVFTLLFTSFTYLFTLFTYGKRNYQKPDYRETVYGI